MDKSGKGEKRKSKGTEKGLFASHRQESQKRRPGWGKFIPRIKITVEG